MTLKERTSRFDLYMIYTPAFHSCWHPCHYTAKKKKKLGDKKFKYAILLSWNHIKSYKSICSDRTPLRFDLEIILRFSFRVPFLYISNLTFKAWTKSSPLAATFDCSGKPSDPDVVSCRVSASLLLVCLYELQKLIEGWKHRETFREIVFYFFFFFCTMCMCNSGERSQTELKSVSQKNGDLCKGQVEVEEWKTFHLPGDCFNVRRTQTWLHALSDAVSWPWVTARRTDYLVSGCLLAGCCSPPLTFWGHLVLF